MTKEKEVSIFDDEMLDEVLKGCKTEKDLFGEKGVVKQFVKRLSERALKG